MSFRRAVGGLALGEEKSYKSDWLDANTKRCKAYKISPRPKFSATSLVEMT